MQSANPHFRTVSGYAAARELVNFEPREPTDSLGHALEFLAVHVRDHKQRDLAIGDRSLEAHYGAFVFSQARRGPNEARRLAVDVAYGAEGKAASIIGREGRLYELGPEPPADDIDGRSPAVVVWHDGDMFYLLASDQLPALALVNIAGSLYP
jgi:hypothetical protein